MGGKTHLHDNGLHVLDLCVDVYKTVSSKYHSKVEIMNKHRTGRPPQTFPSLSTVYNFEYLLRGSLTREKESRGCHIQKVSKSQDGRNERYIPSKALCQIAQRIP